MNLYDTLGVAEDADAATIKRAYRKAAMDVHPDRGGTAAAAAAVNDAYAVLSDPVRRQRYDETGQTAAEPPREAKARETLAQVINEVLDLLDKGNSDDLAYTDPVQVASENLRSNHRQNAKQAEMLARRIAQRREAQGRLQRKKIEGSDVLHDALSGAIAHLEREIAKVDALQILIADMLALLDGYSYALAQRPTQMQGSTIRFEDLFGRFSG